MDVILKKEKWLEMREKGLVEFSNAEMEKFAQGNDNASLVVDIPLSVVRKALPIETMKAFDTTWLRTWDNEYYKLGKIKFIDGFEVSYDTSCGIIMNGDLGTNGTTDPESLSHMWLDSTQYITYDTMYRDSTPEKKFDATIPAYSLLIILILFLIIRVEWFIRKGKV